LGLLISSFAEFAVRISAAGLTNMLVAVTFEHFLTGYIYIIILEKVCHLQKQRSPDKSWLFPAIYVTINRWPITTNQPLLTFAD
jgi:hypothetical protein